MQRVIYIASLDHSGSTMLAKMLGGHSEIISVGEVLQTFKLYKNETRVFEQRLCTCGHIGNVCPLWSEIIQQWDKNQVKTYKQAYMLVLQVFKQLFPNKIILDCSKYAPGLNRILNYDGVEVQVIHLFKDVRTFLISRIARAVKLNIKTNFVKNIRYFKVWFRINQNMDLLIQQNELKSFDVGYEELCFDTYRIMNKLTSFFDLEFEEQITQAAGSDKHHQLIGNNMRIKKEKEIVSYDARWMSRKEWIIPSLIFPKIMKYNSIKVYSNLNQ
ncbi:MAG: hypothetical protein JXR19_01080 [Bacteroidia bacterium]